MADDSESLRKMGTAELQDLEPQTLLFPNLLGDRAAAQGKSDTPRPAPPLVVPSATPGSVTTTSSSGVTATLTSPATPTTAAESAQASSPAASTLPGHQANLNALNSQAVDLAMKLPFTTGAERKRLKDSLQVTERLIVLLSQQVAAPPASAVAVRLHPKNNQSDPGS